MPPVEEAPTTDRLVVQRARLRTLRGRRRRFWRRVAILATVMVLMILVALANRDAQHLRAVRQQAGGIAAALQERYAARGRLPLRFPDALERNLHERYYFNPRYADQRYWRERVGVCCLRQPLRFYVRPAGRMVVIFDGENFSAQWLSEEQFRTEAQALGFESLLDE